MKSHRFSPKPTNPQVLTRLGNGSCLAMNRKSKNSTSSTRLNISQPNNAVSGGTVADMFMLSSDLRPEWRGFSFGTYWFGYYYDFSSALPFREARQVRPM